MIPDSPHSTKHLFKTYIQNKLHERKKKCLTNIVCTAKIYLMVIHILFIVFRDIYIYFSFANNMINLEGEFVNGIPHGNKLYYLNVFDLIFAI